MQNYKIIKIYGEGYERWVKVKEVNKLIEYYVHFIEYDEYLNESDFSKKRKIGDILKGIIKIDLVSNYTIVSKEKTGFFQLIKNSSNITAIAKVKKIESKDSLICYIETLSEEIVVEFEKDIKVNENVVIEITGSLEIEIE